VRDTIGVVDEPIDEPISVSWRDSRAAQSLAPSFAMGFGRSTKGWLDDVRWYPVEVTQGTLDQIESIIQIQSRAARKGPPFAR
jgi:hypothetical protein